MATSATSATTSSTNLDVNSIVSQLMTVERQPITKLNVKEAGYQAKLTAYGSVKGAVASFQSAVQSLSSSSKFQAVKATPSDTTVFAASASSIAVAGTYSLEVTNLAQAQKLVAAGQASSTAAIGDGTATTVTFDFGTISGGSFDAGTGKYTGASFGSSGAGTKSITIDSGNNSLQGIRDAINAAKIGVTATIINDGSATAPYRLALSSDNSGVSNSLKITASGGDGTIATLLAHDPAGLPAAQHLNQTVAAQNADFKVNGVAVTKASNTVSDVVQGVTLTLLNKTATAANLTVARDTAAVNSSISGFVKAYNDLAKTLKDVSAYDAANKQGAVLQGDSTVRSLQSQLRSMLSAPVAGTSGALTTLSTVGVSFQKDGTLALNQTKLDSAIASNFSDIASLFAAVGKGTDSLVGFSGATSNTKPGNYAVNVTQIATQGTSVGSADAGLVATIDGTNDTLNLSVNGVAASITLTHGTTYTAATLAAELQSKINSASALSSAGISVTVLADSGTGKLTITSSNYGSTSSVAITGGSATSLMGTPVETAGADVAGSIGGVAATGTGQILKANCGDPIDLSIVVNGGATGACGMLNYSHGYAYLLDKWATSSLASGGILSSRTDGIGKTITDIGKQRTALETRLVGIEKRYRTQFSSLDAMLSSMNQTSTYLTQQLAQLSNIK
jgi:flagellar hook-associated protein 2